MSWGRNNRSKHDETETALANFALTFAKALLVLCVVIFVMINPNQEKNEGIKPKVEAVVIVDWSGEAKADVDTWIRNPEGRFVWYNNKEAGVVFLDRDDLGDKCITVCEEITSIRGLNEGEYVLNLNLFYAKELENTTPEGVSKLRKPVTVHIKIMQMNPTIRILFEKDVTLTYLKEEMHIVRFEVKDGELVDFDSNRDIKLMQHVN